MAAAYMACIFAPRNGSDWGVTFPDLPGCVSAGATFEDAIENAREALSGHIAALLADGDPLPTARVWAELAVDPDMIEDRADSATLVPIPVLDVPAPKERVNITMSRDVLRQVDNAARAEGSNRSAFLEKAALERLAG